jgi:hypothetical protein
VTRTDHPSQSPLLGSILIRSRAKPPASSRAAVRSASFNPSKDLGNAVRKSAIDLGVSIRFRNLGTLKKRPNDGSDIGAGQDYHAIGEVDYTAADGGGETGTILYIKPGYHGVESAGIRSYAIAHPEFPHEGTADQWFTESQFESYRALGFEIMDGVLNKALLELNYPTSITLDTILDVLQQRAISERW